MIQEWVLQNLTVVSTIGILISLFTYGGSLYFGLRGDKIFAILALIMVLVALGWGVVLASSLK